MKHKIAKRIISGLLVLLLLWLTTGALDFYRVYRFEKPLFAWAVETSDDGGSGRYQGLGYSFDIEGNFMPEDEFPGVTRYQYFLFGNLMKEGIRD